MASSKRTHIKRSSNVPVSPTPRIYQVIGPDDDGVVKFLCNGHVVEEERKKAKTRQYNCDEPTRIEQLSRPLLLRTWGKLSAWHYKRLREASNFFHDLYNELVLHQFRKELQALKMRSPRSYQCIVLKAIEKFATFYLQAGYESTFTGCLLPLLRNTGSRFFCPDIKALIPFVVHFMKLADEQARLRSKAIAKFIYSVTLFKFLMTFPGVRLSTEQQQETRALCCSFELSGSYFAVVRGAVGSTCNQGILSSFMMVVAVLEIAHQLKYIFTNYYDCNDTDSLVYGHTVWKPGAPRLIISIKLVGSPFVVNIFHEILKQPNEYRFELPKVLSLRTFDIFLSMNSMDPPKCIKEDDTKCVSWHFNEAWK